MPRGRHRRGKTLPRKRRIVTFAIPAAVVAIAPVGVAAWPDSADDASAQEAISGLGEVQRPVPLSRGLSDRPPLSPSPTPTPTPTTPQPTPTETPTPEPTVVGHMYVTTGLNVRTAAAEDAEVLAVLARGTKVGVTGTTDGSWVQIIYADAPAWVSGDYLSETEPPAEATGGISFAECESGSAVESGLTPDAIRVHRAVCAEFPDVSSYGGLRSGDSGEHGQGRALDIMVSSSSLGDAIAAWVREHYDELGVSEVIWSQRIWSVERSGDGWRWMEDRGSATANHYDHVHVTVYGNSGG
ncbi:MAG: SH3 domain-containing protein [Jiangellaceae bacterium]